MDAGWNALLNEAAAVSFERGAAVHANRAEENCSTVDLQKDELRALSEKILLLPHQGMLLLFSRYCFHLSPEETESFFEVQNAKGRFRYYRELLSACMGLEQNQVISDASFRAACKTALKEYLRCEMDEEEALASDAEKRSRPRLTFKRIWRSVAIAAIIACMIFSTVMVANADIREKVITWVVETFERYSLFELKRDDPTLQDLRSYKFTYLPEGVTLLNSTEDINLLQYEYGIDGLPAFNFLISQSDTRIYADTENTDIHSLEINGTAGFWFEKESLNFVFFELDGCYCSIYGSLEINELIKVASGVVKK